MLDKLKEIIDYYDDNYEITEDLDEVYKELLDNNVEVKGNSFFCPIVKGDVIILLAGTKDKADLWVLKKIIKLIKSGKPILSLLNGNSDKLLKTLSRYNVEVLSRDKDSSVIMFNKEKVWQ